jgi:glucose-6-phosphate isomerase
MTVSPADIRLAAPGTLEPALAAALEVLDRDDVVRRIWDRDWTVWKDEDREISNRLGWLAAPETATRDIPALRAFASSVRDVGFRRAAVLGMGGSSLAPEVFARLFGTAPGALEIEVLDTTEPGAVAAAGARLDPGSTLFLVSSKSGTTAEVAALCSYFYDRARLALGAAHAGSRFVAITDPGTPLEALAGSLRFRRVFHGRPDIGGRFSALSAFGLVPAALKGLDLERLLAPARAMAEACRVSAAAGNPGARLGAILGAAALQGRDKLTLIMPPRLRPLGAWLEQLVAESTGKEGRGIVPVIDDRSTAAAGRGRDRLLVEIGTAGGPGPSGTEGSGAPSVRLALDDPYDLGGHFFLWEFATAVAARLMGTNPFDQPDVESTKKRTRELLASAAGAPSAADRAPRSGGLRVVRPDPAESPEDALARFLAGRRDGDYLALLTFLPGSPAVEGLVTALASGLRLKTGLPVTVGVGPRYLHSTGQLHKGDGNRGLFLMLSAAGLPELAIPAVPGIVRPAPDFGTLFAAQAGGDALALAEKGRRVLAFEITGPVEPGLASLSSFLG